jgi:hypothetical protein
MLLFEDDYRQSSFHVERYACMQKFPLFPKKRPNRNRYEWNMCTSIFIFTLAHFHAFFQLQKCSTQESSMCILKIFDKQFYYAFTSFLNFHQGSYPLLSWCILSSHCYHCGRTYSSVSSNQLKKSKSHWKGFALLTLTPRHSVKFPKSMPPCFSTNSIPPIYSSASTPSLKRL